MQRIKSKLRKFMYTIPGAKKMRQRIHRIFDKDPDFTGWGMVTHTFNPWYKNGGGEVAENFKKANKWIVDQVVGKKFNLSQFASEENDKDILESLMWRHYILYWTACHAAKATRCSTKNLVECGVCDGLTAFFAMHALSEKYQYKMFLYDAWEGMKSEYLFESEKESIGCYSYLTIENTKNNLSKFSEHTIFHKGFIPDSFTKSKNPSDLIWLHIDLNAAMPTKYALEQFYKELEPGGIIIFDDYGWHGQLDTKEVVDEFFAGKSGTLLPVPTGQAIYFKL